ncbi:hypothetical protein FS749_006510, partial [Ceratobasidium sp. UAMH 11750]
MAETTSQNGGTGAKRTRKIKIFAPTLQREGEHCCICDDGGDIVLCSLCQRPYCFNIREDLTHAVEEDYEDGKSDSGDSEKEYFVQGACITLPREMIQTENAVFRCPECISRHPEFPVDYSINQGAGATQRLAVKSDLVVIILTLPSLTARGQNIFEAIKSQLGAFEMNVDCYEVELPFLLPKGDLRAILSSEYQYHLAFVFLTESSPGGGWWFQGPENQGSASNELPQGAQASEAVWLRTMLNGYDDIVERAVSARIFGLCCGVNLTAPGVVLDIATCLESTKWESIVLPTGSSITPEEYACMFPELFTQLYYKSAPLKSALLTTWSRSHRAREHTGLLLIDKTGDPRTCTVQKYSYAPTSSRPWGVDTPFPESFCNCSNDNQAIKWVRPKRSPKPAFGEYFATLHSSCKHSVLYLAVFAKDFRLVKIGGTTVVVQSYCEELRGFPLDSHERFRFQVAK